MFFFFIYVIFVIILRNVNIFINIFVFNLRLNMLIILFYLYLGNYYYLKYSDKERKGFWSSGKCLDGILGGLGFSFYFVS